MTTDDIMALADALEAIHYHNADSLLAMNVIRQAGPTLRRLHAENETLRYELDAIATIKEERDNWQADAIRFREAASCERTVRLELERQVEALRADAERYRWLAKHCRSTSEHWGGRWSIVIDGPCPKSHNSEDDFDAAIDAARGAK